MLQRSLTLSAFLMAATLAGGHARGDTVADSIDDWSTTGTQGENGWFYGWFNYTDDDDFEFAPNELNLFLNDGSGQVLPDGENHWDGNAWRLYRDTAPQTGPWTTINQEGGHPNGENSAPPPSVPDALPEEHWAVRRWVSTHEGPVNLVAELRDTNTNCGTGTSVMLLRNGDLLDELTTDQATGVSSTTSATIAVGDIIDFALTPVGTDGDRGDPCDGSFFHLNINNDPPPVPPLADSRDQWSTTGTQGENNWFNGYYNLTADDDGAYQTSDFMAFRNEAGPAGGPVAPDGNHWDGTKWDLIAGGGPWTELGQEGTHPNGTNSAPNEEHWTIRRWVADGIEGPTAMQLTWQMRKTNLNGDGVTGVLMVNGQAVDSATIPGNDGTGVTRNFYVNAAPGDIIELALTPQGVTNDGDGADGSANRLTVRTDLPDGPLFNPGEVIADSIAEFSGVQGQDNWFYGYYDVRADAEDGDGVYQPSDLIEFLNDGSDIVSDDPNIGGWKDWDNHWNGNKWDLLDNGAPGANHGPWTELTSVGGHPAANGQGDPEVHWSVRRWVSDTEGEIRIDGILNNVSPNGDGTVGRIFLDGVEIWSELTDGDQIPVDLVVEISEGSVLDFAIDPDGRGVYDPADPLTVNDIQDGNDNTAFNFRIETINRFIPIGQLSGDFDGDGQLTAADIDLLSAAVRSGDMSAQFDLNGDGAVSTDDREVWVKQLRKTWFGDANLDSVFDTTDLVTVFQAGEFEDAIAGNSTWSTGDFDGDADFGTSDLLKAFQDGGFEQGPREGVSAVPEPSSVVLLLIGLLALAPRRRQ